MVLAALAVIARLDYLSGFAVALTGSRLISYYAYPADAVILIPAILIIIETRGARCRAMRRSFLQALSPGFCC